MPIRINLLAEAQAAEELRRKDPVKRGIFFAAAVVMAAVAWSVMLQFKIIRAKGNLNGLEAKWKSIEKEYKTAVEANRRVMDAETKLAALQQLSTNRFLWGNALNALQQSLNGVDHVRVTRLRTEQSYAIVDESKPKGQASDPKTPKPGTATEKVSMTIEAIDSGPQPGSQVTKFKETLAAVPWFQQNLQRTNAVLLHSLSAPQVSPIGRGSFVTFTLNCHFHEKVR
jgi:hypothetical protein